MKRLVTDTITLAQGPGHLDPIDDRHHQIEHDQIWDRAFDSRQRGVAIVGPIAMGVTTLAVYLALPPADIIALLQVEQERERLRRAIERDEKLRALWKKPGDARLTTDAYITALQAYRGAADATADETVAYMLPCLDRGEFYVLCPDNETTRAIDEKRIQWTADQNEALGARRAPRAAPRAKGVDG